MVVDLRSDTVTRPTPEMREAMVRAEVGDDVLDHDPTTLALEEKVAALLGKESALFFPSGVQANQTALAVHGRAGTEVVLEAGAHIFNYEEGAGAALSGLQLRPVHTDDGLLTADLVREAIRPDSPYIHPTSLIALENTHNGAGGKILPFTTMQAIRDVAREWRLPVHLDGARLWHACAETGLSPREYGSLADTVMVCLSKGLGAPVGSLLAGPGDLMKKAWRVRRRLGGGMRQSGFLAAAGIYAMDHHLERLAEDHARARFLAEGSAEIPGVSVVPPETNIVMLDLEDPAVSVDSVLAAMVAEGVLMVRFGPRRLRAVTHLDLDDEGVERAVAVLSRAVEESA
ncbi:MAG: low specificity L-threonine aldolase [Gemmatimonadetes bacterium]|nr:DegT/DnrJ/EryC1/StrS family aminotransferase [Gemmatimonadota bacterium]NNM05937.1 low specificity L-threonine aldolase [Gemmatimonadota bacterium]